MDTTESAVLRARAAELRRVARAIETTPAIELGRQARDDTWRGARPAFCVATLGRHRDELVAAARSLRTEARRFEARAHHLDIVNLDAPGPR